jgi:hypothetical protein
MISLNIFASPKYTRYLELTLVSRCRRFDAWKPGFKCWRCGLFLPRKRFVDAVLALRASIAAGG